MTFVLSLLPIAVLVAALVVVKAPAWKAALAALVVGAAEALFWRGMSAGEFAGCAAQGVSTGLFPIGLVIFAALFTYAITETSGAIADIKGGLCSLSSDSRFLALLVAWGFGNFMEGMAGFGTAVAIPCAILVGVGFDPARAVLCCLVANSTPTAFGSVGVPTSVLASETGLDVGVLTSSIVLLQLAVTALLPFFVLVAADGWRAMRECWKLALGASIAFVVPWCLAARFTGCELPDIVGGITVMTLFAFLGKRGETNVLRQLWAWMPFAFVVVALGAVSMMPPEWKPSPGIVVLSAGALGGLCQGVGPLRLLGVAAKTAKRYALAVLTICTVLSLAKTMVAAGLTRNLAEGLVAATGGGYAAVSGIVGALGGFVTGSGTSTNVLFGALQASVGSSDAERLLFAAANVMGAGIGKMVCPQSIVLGCAAAGLAGRESEVMKRAFPFFVAVLSLACAVAFSFKFFDIIERTLQ